MSEQSTGSSSLMSEILVMAGGLFCLVGIMSGISVLTGYKFALQGAAIPAHWLAAVGFLSVGGMMIGGVHVWSLPSFVELRRNNGFLVYALILVGIVVSGYGVVFVAKWQYYGSLAAWAASDGNVSSVKGYLKDSSLSKEIKAEMMSRALSGNHAKVVQLMLDNGVAPDDYLHRMCMGGKRAYVEMFLKKGVDINVKNKFWGDKTCLGAALTSRWLRVDKAEAFAKYLLKKGAKIGKLSEYDLSRIKRNNRLLYTQLFPHKE